MNKLRVCLVALLTPLAALAQSPAPGSAAPQLALKECRVEGAPVQGKCGVFEVPEDRANPNGRKLGLKVVIIPALARVPEADPLFLFAGGPGQAATDAFGPLIGALERVRKKRDLVLIDQRGTSSSSTLYCDVDDKKATLAERMAAGAFPKDKLEACLKTHPADPRFYTTSIAMQDMDDARAALGYSTINLWGGSYGTRAALVYLREHGEHVRSVVLDGVAPLTMRVPLYFARDAQRAITLLFESCAKDASCNKAFPDLKARFDALLTKLEKEPAKVKVNDPLTGEPTELTIGRETFAGLFRGELYAPELAVLVPLTIDRAIKGDFAPFVAQGMTLSRGMAKGMSLALMLSVLCAEDLPRTPKAEIEAVSAGTFLGPHAVMEFADACAYWPHAEIPAAFHEPVKSDKPVLLLSGELDPVTPPSWAEEAKRTLSNSVHAVAPGVGHGVTSVGCAPNVVGKFIETASTKDLDEGCLARSTRPPFFVSFAGPTP